MRSDVNGPSTSPVYKFLKSATNTGDIQWNFGTYFLVDGNGNVEAMKGVSPKDLIGRIGEL